MIADLKARWPKHSVPPAMLMRLVLSPSISLRTGGVEGLEELEEELERLKE